MLKTSEWVSLGHPDKVADYISCRLLDRYLAGDPAARFAVEVQIKEHYVTLGGEVISSVALSDDEIQYIKYLSIMKDDESPRCDSVDYNIDDSYCANCEDADACFIREVKRLMKN